MADKLSIGFLGFGEIGFALAKGVKAAGAAPVVACDKNAVTGELAEVRSARARELGIELSGDFDILSQSDVVVSAVVPFAAVEAARSFLPYAREGQFYLDVNSSAPTMKKDIEALLAPKGLRVVDASMSGTGVHISGHRGLHIYLSGPDAQRLYDLLLPYDLTLKVLSAEIGAASALKMIRGVVMKGLEGLMVEMLLTAQRFGVGQEVLDSVVAALDEESFADFGTMLVKSHMIHSGRRGDELELIRETVEAAGIEPLMTTAAMTLYRRSTALKVAEAFKGEVPKTWRAAVDEMNHLLPERA